MFLVAIVISLLLTLPNACEPRVPDDKYTVEVHFENGSVKTITCEGKPDMDYNGNLSTGCSVIARKVQSFSIISIEKAPKQKKK